MERDYITSGVSEGVEYSVHDNVRVFDEAFAEPHIGRITRLWQEKGNGTRKVLIRWFFRHKEVKPHADDNPKELFLAFGQGPGVVNENDLDAIVGKCKVVCISKDSQNKQLPATDIENSDYFFSHVYDVDLEHTSPIEEVTDKLGLNAILNKQEGITAYSEMDEKTTELQGNQTLKDDVKKLLSASSPLPEVKKRSRDVEQVSNLQKKKSSKEKLSSDESSMKNKSKASEDKALVSEENQEKAGGDSVSKLSMVMPGQGSNTCDLIVKKLQITDVEKPYGGAASSPTKADGGEKASSEYAESISLEKNSFIQETSQLTKTTMDVPEQDAAAESSQNRSSLREANVREKSDQKKASAISKDTRKVEDMDGLKLAEKTDPGLKEAEPCRGQFSKPKELVELDDILNLENLETERRQKMDFAKEGRSNSAKKMKMASYAETEKRSISTVEMVRAIEKRRIFKELPWEENLEQGLPNGKVLLLQNLDPLATSTDVRDMLKSIFQGLVDAHVLPQESVCPSGQALAIYETKGLADFALEAMDTKCLVATGSNRPIIATRAKESLSQFRFPGHLALDRFKLGRHFTTNEDHKRAVSTSHCSQPNTIEFELAMEWRLLQEIKQNCRAELFKKQRKEVNDFKNRGLSKAQKSKRETL